MDPTPFTYPAEKLRACLGTQRAPTLIDVCLPQDIDAAPWRLPGAIHVAHEDVQGWTSPDGPVVVICQKGLKLSHGAAAILRSRGNCASVLEGGTFGWFAAKGPRLAMDRAPAPGTVWVLPAGRDARSAIATWLIRRWFDPSASVLHVPAPHLSEVAERFAAHALDPGPPWADTCTDLGLEHPSLVTFLTQYDAAEPAHTSLIDALPILHKTEQDWTDAVLTVLDANWTAYRVAERGVA